MPISARLLSVRLGEGTMQAERAPISSLRNAGAQRDSGLELAALGGYRRPIVGILRS